MLLRRRKTFKDVAFIKTTQQKRRLVMMRYYYSWTNTYQSLFLCVWSRSEFLQEVIWTWTDLKKESVHSEILQKPQSLFCLSDLSYFVSFTLSNTIKWFLPQKMWQHSYHHGRTSAWASLRNWKTVLVKIIKTRAFTLVLKANVFKTPTRITLI